MTDRFESALREALERAVPFGTAPEDRWHHVHQRVRQRRRRVIATIAVTSALSIGLLGFLAVQLPGIGHGGRQATSATSTAALVDLGTKTVTLPVSTAGHGGLTMTVPTSWNWLTTRNRDGSAVLILSPQALYPPSADCGEPYFCAVATTGGSGPFLHEDSFVLSSVIVQGAGVNPGPTQMPMTQSCHDLGGGNENHGAVPGKTVVATYEICDRDLTVPTLQQLKAALASARVTG